MRLLHFKIITPIPHFFCMCSYSKDIAHRAEAKVIKIYDNYKSCVSKKDCLTIGMGYNVK